MKRIVCWMVLGPPCLAVALQLCGCRQQAPPPRQIVRPVSIAQAVQRDMPIYVESFGTLDPAENVDIKSQVAGKIISCHFDEGTFVQRGDLLFTVDTNEYVAALLKAQASYEQSQADLKRKRDSYERNRTLRDKAVISADEFEQYKTDFDDAQAACKLALSQVQLADINLDFCTIESPVGGYTGARLVDPGNVVPANAGPSLVNVKRIDKLRLDFTVPEKFLFQIRAALASNSANKVYALLTPQGVDNVIATGVVYFIDNAVDDRSGTIAMRAEVLNSDMKLWAGQFVVITFVVGMQRNAVLVPYMAVQNGQKGPYAFVVTPDKKADLRQVTLGLRYGDLIAIEEGIKPGEPVVTIGQMGLAPGVPVVASGAQP